MEEWKMYPSINFSYFKMNNNEGLLFINGLSHYELGILFQQMGEKNIKYEKIGIEEITYNQEGDGFFTKSPERNYVKKIYVNPAYIITGGGRRDIENIINQIADDRTGIENLLSDMGEKMPINDFHNYDVYVNQELASFIFRDIENVMECYYDIPGKENQYNCCYGIFSQGEYLTEQEKEKIKTLTEKKPVSQWYGQDEFIGEYFQSSLDDNGEDYYTTIAKIRRNVKGLKYPFICYFLLSE